MTPILFALLPVALTVATFPRTTRIVAACMGVVVAGVVASSPVAMTLIVVAMAIACFADGPGTAPTAPGYLDRPAPVRPVVAPVRPVVRFAAPVWDVPTASDLSADLARLVAARDRALASRHRTRADAYQTRIDLVMMSAPVGLA
jgi:hypothetical protein